LTTDLDPPSSDGGTANIAFLQGAAGGPNAQSAQMDCHSSGSKRRPSLVGFQRCET
jgi:hypothetical protein